MTLSFLRFADPRPVLLAATTVALAVGFHARPAAACGGCFHPENDPETTVVTGHRMVLSISTKQTVLWDQVRYSGAPSEFAWVLPIKPGGYVDVGNDAWFDTLDAATSTRVVAPPLTCPGVAVDDAMMDEGAESSGCSVLPRCSSNSMDEMAFAGAGGSDGMTSTSSAPHDPVTVVHEGSVGPYETVTLHANEQGALTTWLTANGYAIDADVQPIIDAYSSEGFDFIAVRLAPDQGIQQMQPIRVTAPGSAPTLPLRMVAAGTGASTAISLFVIGEGRWDVQNFPSLALDSNKLEWDFATSDSNYSELRASTLAEGKGDGWLTTFAKQGALLSPVTSAVTGGPIPYTTANGAQAATIAEAYFAQGYGDGATQAYCGAPADVPASWVVVDTCPPDQPPGEPCPPVGPNEIDAALLTCDTLDDLAIALVGMHPGDVWLTRLESELPRAALAKDLQIQAAAKQEPVDNWHQATTAKNAPCAPAGAAPPLASRRDPRSRSRERDAAMVGIFAAVAAITALRRARRRMPVPVRCGHA